MKFLRCFGKRTKYCNSASSFLRSSIISTSMRSSSSENTPLRREVESVAEDVIMHKVDTKLMITLNRPKALNALNLSMINKILPKLSKYNSPSSSEIKLVIMKGEGDKAFCSGGDIRAIHNNAELSKEFFREEYKLNYLISTLKMPYVALIDGITMGGGVGLSIHGTFRVATERTVFAMPECLIGLFPDIGGSYFLPKMQGKLGTYLGITGTRLKGRDLVEAGVATHFVDSELMGDLEKELLMLKSENIDKTSVYMLLSEFSLRSRTIKEEFSLKRHMDKINRLFAGNTIEEVILNLEKDGSQWSKDTLDTLAKMSPTSLKLTIRELGLGANMSLKDCLEMEYRITQRICENTDFCEGVKAVLIEKTNKPKWNPSELNKVSSEMIDYYFSPLPPGKELCLS